MNIQATGSVGLWLLEHGGLQAVTDMRTLFNVYQGLNAKPPTMTFAAATTSATLDAVERTLKLLCTAVQDPTERANLQAVVASL